MNQRPLKIGVQPDLIGKESYSARWMDALTRLGHSAEPIDLLAEGTLDSISQFDGIMWRWAHNPQDKQSAKQILYVIENYYHIPVFPNQVTAWHYDEKVSQYYLLKALNVPVPTTWLFWKKEDALAWLTRASYPVVFKLSSGAASANVVLVETMDQARDLVEKMFGPGIFPYTTNEFKNRTAPQKGLKPFLRYLDFGLKYARTGEYPPLPEYWWRPEHGYAYFQEFLPGNEFDTRITVIGNRAFGFRRQNRSGDFRASGSGTIDFDPRAIDPRCLKIAFEVSNNAGFQSMAYDFLVNDGQPVIVEISYTFADEAVASCPGHWNSELGWVETPMYPETAQVEDFVADCYIYNAMRSNT